MKLAVLQNSVDVTLKMDDFGRPAMVLDLSLGEIMLGYPKPIKNFYIEQETRNVSDVLSLKYLAAGSVWTDVPGLEDRTFGLAVSGLVRWREVEQIKSTIGGKELYWLKLTTATPAAVSINAINLVLSSDSDFGSNSGVLAYLEDNATSFIEFHQDARDMIIQRVRSSNQRITGSDLNPKQVDQFDLMDIEEFRQASKYLALGLIYENISRAKDDMYDVRAKRFMERYELSFNQNFVTIDSNDNGKNDDGQTAINSDGTVTELGTIRIQNG